MESPLQKIVIECPHCKEFVVIEEINCNIFRHGTMKDSGKQMDPHTPKEICDQLKETDAIYGCGKPFSLVKKEEEYVAEICEYI
jgi:hypothetical protein